MSDDSVQPGMRLEMELFRVKHYIYVYNLALEVTGASDVAKELTERVFENAARRFEHHPIPANCDMYLAAQVYLLYASRDLPNASSASAGSEGFSPAPTPPGDAQAVPKSTANKTESSSAPNAAQTPSASVSAAESTAVPAAESPRIRATAPDSNHAPGAAEAVYDRKRTEFWTPDSEPMRVRTADAAQEEIPEDEEAPDTPSVALSLLNALLVLASLASVAFLLMEMNILPGFL